MATIVLKSVLKALICVFNFIVTTILNFLTRLCSTETLIVFAQSLVLNLLVHLKPDLTSTQFFVAAVCLIMLKLGIKRAWNWKFDKFRMKKLRHGIFGTTRPLNAADFLIQDSCFICLEDFNVGDLVPSIPHDCLQKRHFMHQACAETWFEHVKSTGN